MKDYMQQLRFCWKAKFLYLQAQHVYDSYLIKGSPNQGCAMARQNTYPYVGVTESHNRKENSLYTCISLLY